MSGKLFYQRDIRQTHTGFFSASERESEGAPNLFSMLLGHVKVSLVPRGGDPGSGGVHGQGVDLQRNDSNWTNLT